LRHERGSHIQAITHSRALASKYVQLRKMPLERVSRIEMDARSRPGLIGRLAEAGV